MKHLLKIEWMKLKDYTVFKVLSIFFVLGVVLVNYIVYTVNKNVISNVNGTAIVGSFSPYNFSNTWESTSYASGYLLILPVLLLIIIFTNEYTFKTSRQNIIDGISRPDFIKTKLVMALLAAVFCTVTVILTAFVFGIFSGTDFSLNKFSHVGFFFLKALSYFVLAIFISVLVKRTGFALGIFFIYMGAENIISQLLEVWSMKLKKVNNLDFGNMGDYLPMNASDGLLSFPDNPIKSLAKSQMPTDYFWVVLGLAIGYLVLFTWLSYKKFTKADL